MRLSPLLLGLAALGFGWASPVLAEDGADCGFLCQVGGYLSTDHMTASPGDGGSGPGAPAKAHKPHLARKPAAKPATREAAHGAAPATEHARTAPAPVAVAKPGDAAPAVRKAAAGQDQAGKGAGGQEQAAKPAAVAKAVTAPPARTPARDAAKPQVAASRAAPPGASTPARTIARPSAVAAAPAAPVHRTPAAVKATATETAGLAPDHAQARRHAGGHAADRPGGTVEIASASAVPSPGAVPAKPARGARGAPSRRTVAPASAEAERPVIMLTALAAIPGSAPAMPAGFQPATVTAH